ncbi:MAG: hypothetical protein U0792_11700 [Gemmataceae bacterium]
MPRTRIREKESHRPGPPVTFRPGPDLEQLARPFVERHGLPPAVAFKNLATLALIGLDRRHYPLVAQLAAAIVGDNSFSRACVYIQAALVGAAVLRDGLVVEEEPRRSQFVFDVVRCCLSERGGEVKTEGLWFTPVVAAPQPDATNSPGSGTLTAAEPAAGESVPASAFGAPPKRQARSKAKDLERAAAKRAETGKA